ncbi:DUF4142 domain-containing protein [Sphingobium yanoikuyae]|uniref:DUF4142 domain-containing protein n=1 Tax=Sphingobium yanoikuyae TaxID=13690 RepID=UPI002035D8BD|nr:MULTISPECIES: DUF4142 domain-containing protein [Sphingobium]WBQ19437.1 DUF4142 domain-containing protein [Sphingobium yanoikuyae]
MANSQSASVKTLVVSMIKADTESAMKLAAAASETSLAIVPTPSSMAVRQKTLLMLKEKKGAGFDAA